jgi:hypothetical protein
MLSAMKQRLRDPALPGLGREHAARRRMRRPRGDRAAFAAEWQAQGLQPVDAAAWTCCTCGRAPPAGRRARRSRRSRWSCARAGSAPTVGSNAPACARRKCSSSRTRVATIVGDEVREAFGGPVGAGGAAPVLQVRVLDLYLNAPEMQAAVASKTYTNAFGDMVLVAELRAGPDGPLLLASWDHRPAREFVSPRLTTRVENVIEVRAAARAWARHLRREVERLGAGG